MENYWLFSPSNSAAYFSRVFKSSFLTKSTVYFVVGRGRLRPTSAGLLKLTTVYKSTSLPSGNFSSKKLLSTKMSLRIGNLSVPQEVLALIGEQVCAFSSYWARQLDLTVSLCVRQ